jgi:hypothetical protein
MKCIKKIKLVSSYFKINKGSSCLKLIKINQFILTEKYIYARCMHRYAKKILYTKNYEKCQKKKRIVSINF